MSPNQPRADNPARAIRIDDVRWEALKEAAESQGTDASKVIRDMIDVYLDGLA